MSSNVSFTLPFVGTSANGRGGNKANAARACMALTHSNKYITKSWTKQSRLMYDRDENLMDKIHRHKPTAIVNCETLLAHILSSLLSDSPPMRCQQHKLG